MRLRLDWRSKNLFWFLGMVSTFFLVACYQYIQIPIEIQDENVSPPYLLQIKNDTTSDLILEPNGFGKQHGFSEKIIKPNETADIILQVKKFKVNPTDITGSNEVVSGPYIENFGARRAVVRFKNEDFPELLIDLDSENWFASVKSQTPQPRILEVIVKDFNKTTWFIGGPDNP